MEPELFRDQEHQKSFWRDSPIPYAIVSPKGDFVHVNPAWAKLLGYSESELTGANFASITHPQDLEADKAELQRIINVPSSTGYSMVKRYISKSGGTVWVELHVSAIREPDGKLKDCAVTVIPLPNHDSFKIEQVEGGYVVRPSMRIFDLVRDNPRESIIASLIVLVGFKVIPVEGVLEIIKTFLLK